MLVENFNKLEKKRLKKQNNIKIKIILKIIFKDENNNFFEQPKIKNSFFLSEKVLFEKVFRSFLRIIKLNLKRLISFK